VARHLPPLAEITSTLQGIDALKQCTIGLIFDRCHSPQAYSLVAISEQCPSRNTKSTKDRDAWRADLRACNTALQTLQSEQGILGGVLAES